MERYFIKFPTLTYANTECLNLTRRITVEEKLKLNPSLYHKYTVREGERADLLADSYYEDSYYSWLIYLNNGIVDPYYGWYMDNYDFNNYIVKKYGSVEQAQKKIFYYQLNWPGNDVELSPSFYENNLPEYLKKYYSPVFNKDTKIISYTRKKDDFVTNTNKLLDFTVTGVNGNGFVKGEIIDIYNSTMSSVIGGAEVVFANTTAVKVHHISGNTEPTNKILGETSNTLATISQKIILFENLTDDEAVYWSPVYFYEYELEKNEKNKNVRLLDSSFSLDMAEELRTLLRE
jgi:hypothetical protein